MRETLRQFVFGVAALFVVGALCSIGLAFPGGDFADCTECHNGDGLDADVAPSALMVVPGEKSEFEFDILDIPLAASGALAVRGFDDAALWDVLIGPSWTDENPAANQYYQLDDITETGVVSLAVDVGMGTALGSYPLTAQFVSNDGRGVTDFDGAGDQFMRFTLHVVPEPSALVLAAFGLVGLVAYGWRRKRNS